MPARCAHGARRGPNSTLAPTRVQHEVHEQVRRICRISSISLHLQQLRSKLLCPRAFRHAKIEQPPANCGGDLDRLSRAFCRLLRRHIAAPAPLAVSICPLPTATAATTSTSAAALRPSRPPGRCVHCREWLPPQFYPNIHFNLEDALPKAAHALHKNPGPDSRSGDTAKRAAPPLLQTMWH